MVIYFLFIIYFHGQLMSSIYIICDCFFVNKKCNKWDYCNKQTPKFLNFDLCCDTPKL